MSGTLLYTMRRGFLNVFKIAFDQEIKLTAEPLFLRSIQIWEQRLGPRHRTTLQGYQIYALFLIQQTRMPEALPILQRIKRAQQAN